MTITVKSLLHDMHTAKGDQGMELEVEFLKTPSNFVSTYWDVKTENSLRNFGMEFITKGPINIGRSSQDAIKELVNYCNKNNAVNECPRASFHTHVNVLDMTAIEVYTFATCYWLVEDLLFKYCGSYLRAGNLFCLRLSDASGIMRTIMQELRSSGPPFGGFNNNHIRYAGLNFNALYKFGSLEFRGMRCALDDKILITWTEELQNLKNNSKTFSSPMAVMEFYFKHIDTSPITILQRFFSYSFAKYLSSYHGWTDDIQRNELNLIQFCCDIEWSSINEKYRHRLENNPKPREKKQGITRNPIPTALRTSFDQFVTISTPQSLTNQITIDNIEEGEL